MKQVLHTEKAPAAIGPYAQGWKVGDMVYTSGQLGIDMETGKLAEGVEAQARTSMRNVGEILKAAGASYGDVVKTTFSLRTWRTSKPSIRCMRSSSMAFIPPAAAYRWPHCPWAGWWRSKPWPWWRRKQP